MASPQAASRHHECALCMEEFTSPRLLPCFHTFCLSCLQRLVDSRQRSRTFPCPTCRTSITIPPGGVEKFQVNFYLELEDEGQKADTQRKARLCDMCRKNPVTYKCNDCNLLACSKCTAVHTSIPATRSHTVVQLKTAQGPGCRATKERYCTIHTDEKIRFFCIHCSAIICRDCKLTSHEGHATTDLSAKSSEAKKVLVNVTKHSRKCLEPKLRQRLKEADSHRKNVQEKKKAIQAQLEQRAEELKQEIDKSLSEAKQKLRQETESVDKTIATCLSAMNQELAQFLSLTENAEQVVRTGCEADILEMPTQMQRFYFVGQETDGQPYHQNTDVFGGFYQDLTGVVNQQFFDPGLFDGNKSDYKLKSFIKTNWNLVVQVDDASARCVGCSSHYDKNLGFCPSCGTQNIETEIEEVHFWNNDQQCGQCGDVYTQDYDFCPTCGAAATADPRETVLATAKKTITNYIGHVTKSDQSQQGGDTSMAQNSFSSWAAPRSWNNSQQFRHQPQAKNTAKTAETLSNEIIADISTIQSSLSEWQIMLQNHRLSGLQNHRLSGFFYSEAAGGW